MIEVIERDGCWFIKLQVWTKTAEIHAKKLDGIEFISVDFEVYKKLIKLLRNALLQERGVLIYAGAISYKSILFRSDDLQLVYCQTHLWEVSRNENFVQNN